ncbi:DNA/RNA non-specific endonuclease [Eubacterium oxidoreducens]|uniref:DNA-entry nuclease n=1 Tax=Eubacterium oxidoreducens TaxID=1732 RepID=A0A1G6AH63_EUBOX|nr:DNA/RNA non-specific endonuclease [Eubacterium oxidoreducens]SDB07646.1 DNA-entry nuclease [Eubacterium oxidoreducens]
MRKLRQLILPLILLLMLMGGGCSQAEIADESLVVSNEQSSVSEEETKTQAAQEEEQEQESHKEAADSSEQTSNAFDITQIPEYCGVASYVVNNNEPYFTEDEITDEAFEDYGALDSLGRCTTAFACVGTETMPTQERGSIGSVKPTGWHTVKYNGIDGNYLYNRCHLIAYCLGAENANEKNLITGTRYMNVEGMLPYEEETASYIDRTQNHVMYRVTPIFEENNFLASGVLMEAYSVEDEGEGICFCVYCYNVQPDITIDYATGDSKGEEFTGSASSASDEETSQSKESENTTDADYVINTNTKKFHLPTCSSVKRMAQKNTKTYHGDRQELIDEGYDPCGNCNP